MGSDLNTGCSAGQSVSTKVAPLPLENYPGEIVSDLFGEEAYFAERQSILAEAERGVAARRTAYADAGGARWSWLEPGSISIVWNTRDHQEKGGKVSSGTQRGEVVFQRGLSSGARMRAGARRTGKGAHGQGSETHPEVSSVMQNYLDLHRHAAVRVRPWSKPGVALRLMLAHAIAGLDCGRFARSRRPPGTSDCGQRSDCAADGNIRTGATEVLAFLGFERNRGCVLAQRR